MILVHTAAATGAKPQGIRLMRWTDDRNHDA